MKSTLRSLSPLFVAGSLVVALGACSSGPSELIEPETGEQSDPLTIMTVNPNAFTPPPWVGECDQVAATYFVKLTQPWCMSINTSRGRWAGCSVQPGVNNGYCVYKWTSNTPETAPAVQDYGSLQAAAELDRFGHYAIQASCAPPETCPPTHDSAQAQNCTTAEECCESVDDCIWTNGQCKCGEWKIENQPSCDVCGFIRDGRLTAFTDPRWPDTRYYLVSTGSRSWVVTSPYASANSFTVLLDNTLQLQSATVTITALMVR